MRNISQQLKLHLSQEVITIATCWQIILVDNTILGFTNHDQDLLINNTNYISSTCYYPEKIAYNSNISLGNTKIEGILNSNKISQQDILAGKYDFAKVEIFIVNYKDLNQGKVIIFNGTIGKVSINNDKFIAELNGLSAPLAKNLGDLFSPICRAQFCDDKCKIDAKKYTKISTVTKVTNDQTFEDNNLRELDHYYQNGKVTFLTGNNTGFSCTVKSHRKSTISLFNSPPYKIDKNIQYSIIAGCDKSFTTCKNKFSNAKNFRGEPNIPGNNILFGN